MPRVTGVRRDRRLNGKGSKGQGPNGQCKASINPAAAASLSAANWQRECKKGLSTSRTIGRSGGPFRLSRYPPALRVSGGAPNDPSARTNNRRPGTPPPPLAISIYPQPAHYPNRDYSPLNRRDLPLSGRKRGFVTPSSSSCILYMAAQTSA
jgi:hypothetical protein